MRSFHLPCFSVEIAASLLRGDTDFAFPVSSTGVPQVKSGKLEQQFANAGAATAPSPTPEAFAAFVKSENAKWREIVKLSSAKAD